jgi:type I restriction enzyme S subunit
MASPFLIHPPGWHVATLEANRNEGFIERVESGGTPKTSVEEYWDGDVPWLTPKEITRRSGGLYASSTERLITQKGLSSSGAKLMPAGTVMLTKRAPVGAVAVAAVPMCTNQGFLNFVCGPKLLPAYLAYWLLANRPYLDAVANGSTYPELYKSDLFEFEIAIPSIEKQHEVLKVITSTKQLMLLLEAAANSAVDVDQVLNLQNIRGKVEHVFGGLLPLLLSGQIKMQGAL